MDSNSGNLSDSKTISGGQRGAENSFLGLDVRTVTPVTPYIWMALWTTCKQTKSTEMFKLVSEVGLVFHHFNRFECPEVRERRKSKEKI